MGFSTDLYTFLSDNITTAAQINANKTNGDYESYLIYQKINNSPEYDYDGYADISTITFQFTAYAKRKVTAENIIEELKNLLSGYKGMINTTKVAGVFATREYSDIEKETNLYREEVDFDFKYYE